MALSNTAQNILQYESTIWSTADLLRGCGIKESEWPSYMMPFFALVMIESRLIRMFDDLKTELGEDTFNGIEPNDLIELIQDKGQGYNVYIFEKHQTLKDICQNDKSFDVDFDAYLKGYDGETKDLLGVDAFEGEKFLDIKGVIAKLKAKKVLFSYVTAWSSIDLKPFDNSAITTLEEHIKRRWADISAETAGEQYTPDDVIALIAEIIASKIEDSGRLLKIYDCTCGGGNLLFGVEDRIKEKVNRLTQTYGQDWNDALYALAKIEGRFRVDSKIEHGNTLTDDKFFADEFDVVVANPPYGVDWKGFQKDIQNDKTQRFQHLPAVSDGQLLFMQHLISKMNATGMGVVVHNGSTLFSGDAGSGESNIRKWMLDNDLVEAVIQLPTDEFFNTNIYTYLWVLNKQKPDERKDRVMLINASEKFKPLKKNKGSKRKEIDEANRLEIVDTLGKWADNDYARVFDKEFFYFNKQAIMLTNVDEQGRTFADRLKDGKKSRSLKPVKLDNGERTLTEFTILEPPENPPPDSTPLIKGGRGDLSEYFTDDIKPFVSSLDYKEQPLVVTTEKAQYSFDADQETLIKEVLGKREALGCGKIVVKSAFKKKTKTKPESIVITVELTPDYQKDYEIIPYHRDPDENRAAIEAFMAKYITKPFEYLENVVGVEINFNKVFYQPEQLRSVEEILDEISTLDKELRELEQSLSL
ncbi:SAM-dependent methyltransferase [Candidatus Synechococcus calcipolaris G9]|uniref:site-specific DNA-methyltransferase (adenine-specific) n=1 Tax=Candidatus Synechococcus calcipolaris G9 TaxID=1497997 RepID=A0ABT6EZP4_9SYNE|nr:N-6 DNA methylase [Candidatus Synechococcus calcipolaris]MDG2991084.1 SAM-dependent methyltransferase [Candidatus Synechococcus calcipolaris G9]